MICTLSLPSHLPLPHSLPSDNTHDKTYIMLKDRLSALFKEENEYTILEEMKGESLVGKKYQPLFDYFAHLKSEEPGKGAFRVIR